MESIITVLVDYVQGNDDRGGDANGKSENIEKGELLMSDSIAPGQCEHVSKHGIKLKVHQSLAKEHAKEKTLLIGKEGLFKKQNQLLYVLTGTLVSAGGQ